jgi:hypothetical protein
MNPVPFGERKTRLRAPLDLLTGCYPRFLLGGRGSSQVLPAFHFHQATEAGLTPWLDHLVRGGYRTLSMDEAEAFVQGRATAERSVVLCFDDAWSSLWTVAEPMLRARSMRAVAFAIPGRTLDARAVRPQRPDSTRDDTEQPFCTWPELQAMAGAGVVEVQSHTHLHARGFGAEPTLKLEAATWSALAPLDRPWLDAEGRFATAEDVGRPWAPLVSAYGTAPVWLERQQRFETGEERTARLRRDLGQSREVLEARLGRPVRHLCFPWAVAGAEAEASARHVGFATAFADRLFGTRAILRGQNPYRLMRLRHTWIPRFR